MPVIESSTRLQCSARALRDYLGQTAKLPSISDPELKLNVIQADSEVTAGGLIEFSITAYGLKQSMQHRYVEVSDSEIVAEQIEGPTRAWKHRQTITDHGDGSCTLTDTIEFEPPGGMLGFVMTEQKIRESVEEGMEFRYSALKEILEDDSTQV